MKALCRFKATIRLIIPILAVLHSRCCYGQSPDVRTQAEYHHAEDLLKLKYEYYYDFWSERNVLHGRYTEWSSNEQMILDCYYKHGKLDSLYKSWFINGEVKEISRWKDDKRNGRTQYFDRKGWLEREIVYSNGEMNGLVTKFYKSGKVRSIEQYRSGQRHGHSTNFAHSGEKKKMKYFVEGKRQEPDDQDPDMPAKDEGDIRQNGKDSRTIDEKAEMKSEPKPKADDEKKRRKAKRVEEKSARAIQSIDDQAEK